MISLSAVIVLLLLWHVHICRDYPYYFIWDMDYITCLDTVLIQSELLPDHISHTGFGMYLLLSFSEKIAHCFSAVSAINLTELAASLNPLAPMAELTDFIRLHSPFLTLSITLMLTMAIYLMFNLSRWYILLFLLILGSQESLTYHSSMVRTEFYSIFYWSGAVLTMALAAKTVSPARKYLMLLLTGLLLGLSFLTKAQALIYLVELLFLLVFAFSLFQEDCKQHSQDAASAQAYLILAVSLANIIAFIILAAASLSVSVPQGIPTWSAGFGITPMTVIFFLAFLLLLLSQIILSVRKKTSTPIFRFSGFFSFIAAGFLLTFALHFLLYSDAGLSLQYMLLDFKMVFLRDSKFFQPKTLHACFSNFLLYVSYNPVLFIVIVALNLFLVIGRRFGFVKITKGRAALCLLITSLAFINIFIATRFILRDILWKEVLLDFLILLYFTFLISRTARYRLLLVGLLVALLLANCAHAFNTHTRIDANYNHYGWRQDKWLTEGFGGNHRLYRRLMLEKYNNITAQVAMVNAPDYRHIRKMAAFVFKNQTITLRNIGIVFPGFPAWSSDLGYRLIEVPNALRGAILVDNSSVARKKTGFFKEEYVIEHSEHADKFKKSSSDKISILTRSDLKIFLFVHPEDVSSLMSEQIVGTDYKIVLRIAGQTVEMQGLEITNYCEVPLDKITKKFFFVIQKI